MDTCIPMKKSHRHLRDIREAIGDTRKTFAARISCSEVFVKSVESGKRNLSPDMLTRLFRVLGVSRTEFENGRSVGANRAPYSRAWFESWQKWRQRDRLKSLSKRIEHSLAWVRIVLEAASHEGKLDQAADDLAAWMEKARSEFCLERTIDADLSGRTYVEKRKYRVGDLRRNKGLASFYKWKQRHNDMDEDIVEVEATVWDCWGPGADAPKPRKG